MKSCGDTGLCVGLRCTVWARVPCFAGDLNIQEGDGVVLLLRHGEFDEWMLAVHQHSGARGWGEGQHYRCCPVQTLL